jgi:AraC-like DNA-binding protein
MRNRRHPEIFSPGPGSGGPRVRCPRRGDLGCLWEHAHAAGYRVDELAERLACCPRCLTREFRRVFGVTAKQWLAEARDRECRRRLRGEQSLAEIAGSLGFSHPKQLSREFRNLHRISPSAYRFQEKRRKQGQVVEDKGKRTKEKGKK